MAKKRNYRKEYENYQGTEEQLRKRAARNRVRRDALRRGIVKKGDKLDIHHIDGNPHNDDLRNLAVRHQSKNRSFKRNKDGTKKA